MKPRIACGVLAIVGVIALPAAAVEPTLKLLFAPPFVMPIPVAATPGLAPTASLPLPVALSPGLSAEQICVEKVGLRFLNVVDATLGARFAVEPRIAASSNAIPTVTINVADPASLRPGEYQLLIRSNKCKAEAAPEPLESLVVPLTRSGVKLEALGKVTVDQWLAAPWSEAASAVNPSHVKVRATEETKTAPITALQADALAFTTSGTGINVGEWAVAALNLPGKPGDAAVLSLAPKGFPVGVASGRIEVRGPDLLAPFGFDIEVRTRLAARWIAIIVIAGVAFGWLLRVWLQRRIDLAKARKPGFDELQRLQGEVDRIADTDFLEAVSPPLHELKLALDGDDAPAIATASTQARTAVDTARTRLNEALKAVALQIDALRGDFDVQAPLPAALAGACAAAMSLAAQAAEDLTARNAASARTTIAAGERRLGEQLAAAWTDTKAAIDAQLVAFEGLAPLLSPSQRERLTDALKKRRDECNVVGAPDRQGASAFLKAVAQIGRELCLTLDWAGRALIDDAEHRVRHAQERVQNPSDLDTVSADLRQHIDAVSTALHAQLALDNGFARPQWGSATSTAIETTARLLKRVLDLQTAETQAKVRDQMAGKPFDEAIEAIPVDDPKLHTRTLTPPSGRELGAAERTFTEAKRSTVTAPAVDLALGEIAAAAKRNLAELLVAEFWMALGVGLVLAAVSYAFYQERFVGTWPELLGLFFWGFSADLGADKIATKVKELGVVLKA